MYTFPSSSPIFTSTIYFIYDNIFSDDDNDKKKIICILMININFVKLFLFLVTKLYDIQKCK